MLFIYFLLYIAIGVLFLLIEGRYSRNSVLYTILWTHHGSPGRMAMTLLLELLIWPTWIFGLLAIAYLYEWVENLWQRFPYRVVIINKNKPRITGTGIAHDSDVSGMYPTISISHVERE